ncbi:MAG TPA: SpvB/TcaC N-terminal domain-containing protein, partial [Chloroflexota bacterium]|nr:SpvB/TcaC N-terminal domain-containing protein [Chloroflexota bacterium]
MGESFSAQLSTGVATFSVPISLPGARGQAQPSLSLSYSSGDGNGVAGMGWSIGVPSIARQTDRRIPKYDDPPPNGAWHPEQDRFVFNGGQELVPICLVKGKTCDATLPAGEELPDDMTDWQYFRPRVEGSFQRFFWSPDHHTWRVQDKSGVTMELGVPFGGSDDAQALEFDPNHPEHIYRWNLVREYDAHVEPNPPSGVKARPVNVVTFQYVKFDDESYLSDIYDTPPAQDPTTPFVKLYAHHTHLNYDVRPDVSVSFRRGWQTSVSQRLVGIDVASKTFGGDISSSRRLVRRYHLAYDADLHQSILRSVQVEGRCSGNEADAPAEDTNQLFVGDTHCPLLPAMSFDYQHVLPFDTSGNPSSKDLDGYEGFDERVRAVGGSPPNSVDETLTGFFDINSDGLPDVLVTAPGLFGGKHGVFFNGDGGQVDSFGAAQPMGVVGVDGADEGTITLKNQNIAP